MKDWRECELRKSISEFLSDYFAGQKLKNIEASIDTLVVYALEAKEKEVEERMKEMKIVGKVPLNASDMGYNEAIDDILKSLKKGKKK